MTQASDYTVYLKAHYVFHAFTFSFLPLVPAQRLCPHQRSAPFSYLDGAAARTCIPFQPPPAATLLRLYSYRFSGGDIGTITGPPFSLSACTSRPRRESRAPPHDDDPHTVYERPAYGMLALFPLPPGVTTGRSFGSTRQRLPWWAYCLAQIWSRARHCVSSPVNVSNHFLVPPCSRSISERRLFASSASPPSRRATRRQSASSRCLPTYKSFNAVNADRTLQPPRGGFPTIKNPSTCTSSGNATSG